MINKTRPLIIILSFFFSSLGIAENPIEEKERPNNQTAKVSIIIDDLGYNKAKGLAMINLPGALTFAIIPHSPNAIFLAEQAKLHNKEVMLHAPMSNINDFPMGEVGLNESMGEAEFNRALIKAIESVPHIKGVNNHMGSLLTQKHLPMEWTMERLSERGLYFIDSRTTARSVAWRTAQISEVPSLKRDVFLDNERDSSSMQTQFDRLIKKAKRRGYAIAIAHPYPETLAFLEENLKTLSRQGVELVPASYLVNNHSPNLKRIQASATQQ